MHLILCLPCMASSFLVVHCQNNVFATMVLQKSSSVARLRSPVCKQLKEVWFGLYVHEFKRCRSLHELRSKLHHRQCLHRKNFAAKNAITCLNGYTHETNKRRTVTRFMYISSHKTNSPTFSSPIHYSCGLYMSELFKLH